MTLDIAINIPEDYPVYVTSEVYDPLIWFIRVQEYIIWENPYDDDRLHREWITDLFGSRFRPFTVIKTPEVTEPIITMAREDGTQSAYRNVFGSWVRSDIWLALL